MSSLSLSSSSIPDSILYDPFNNFSNSRLQNDRNTATFNTSGPLASDQYHNLHKQASFHITQTSKLRLCFVFPQVQTLQTLVTQLEAENAALFASKTAYEEAFTRLTGALQLLPDTQNNIPNQILVSYPNVPRSTQDVSVKLTEEDVAQKYPNIRFWTIEKFKMWEKSPEVLGEGRGPLAFLENKDGTPFASGDVTAMMKKMRAIWQGFKLRGNPPATWGAATHEMKEEFYGQINRSFPDIGLCANNWKAEMAATLRYSSWAQTHLRGIKDTQSTTGKRGIKSEESNSLEPDSKRMKQDDDSDHTSLAQHTKARDDIPTDSSLSPIDLTASSSSESDGDAAAVVTQTSDESNAFKASDPERTDSDKSNPVIVPVPRSARVGVLSSTIAVKCPLARLQAQKDSDKNGSSEEVPPLSQAKSTTTSGSVFIRISRPQAVVNSSACASTSESPSDASESTSDASESTSTSKSATTAPVVPASASSADSPASDATLTTPPTTGALGVIQVGTSESPPTVAERTWQPQKARKARTLCAYRWLRQVNDHGTSNDFTLYWKKITTEQKKKYDEECASLISSKGWVGFTPDVINVLSQGCLY